MAVNFHGYDSLAPSHPGAQGKDALREAAAEVLALPCGVDQLRQLDRGIGTKTPDVAWLRLRSALSASASDAGGGEERLNSEAVRAFALKHDHLAVPIRPGVTVTWTDEETGEVIQRATLKGRNVIDLAASTQVHDAGEQL